MAIEWFINQPGLKEGPFTAIQVKEFVSTQAISPDTPIRKGSQGKWVRAGDVKGLFNLTLPTGKVSTIAVQNRETRFEPNSSASFTEQPTQTQQLARTEEINSSTDPQPMIPDVNNTSTQAPLIHNQTTSTGSSPLLANSTLNSHNLPPQNYDAASASSRQNHAADIEREIDQHARHGNHQEIGLKSKTIAGVLALIPLAGMFGIHDFYLGRINAGVAKVSITVFTCFIGGFISQTWSLVDGIILLGSGGVDGQGRPLQ